MIEVKAFTYEQFTNNIEDTENFYVNDIEKDMSRILESNFPKNVMTQEIFKLSLNQIEVLQIKTPDKNLMLVKNIKQLSLSQMSIFLLTS
jgi:hypothetical protein